MKPLADLYLALDRTNKTREKIELLADFFRHAPADEKIWALALLSGRRPRRQVKTSRLRVWAAEEAGIPDWLFNECYEQVGDLAETIALLLPPPGGRTARSTGEWIALLSELKQRNEGDQRRVLTDAWKRLSTAERLVFNKLITGEFRVGVSQALVTRALSEATGLGASLLAHRLMGDWNPHDVTFQDLVSPERPEEDLSHPYPFCLAHPLERPPAALGPLAEWVIEWKWDGIRGQLIRRGGKIFLWSRGEELVTDRFPEFRQFESSLPPGTVLDGEVLPYRDRPLDFSALQRRIGRKSVTPRLQREVPVAFIAYDLLEWGGEDLRSLPLDVRRRKLVEALNPDGKRRWGDLLFISEELDETDWAGVVRRREEARDYHAEGLMIKRRDAPYATGRPKGIWWKWKVEPLSVDAVLLYAQPGHGRRSGLFTDYTFGVWSGQELVPFAKAYSGLTDGEIREVDTFVRRRTREKHGPVRIVAPELVFEIGFAHVALSRRHRAGVAVRFPRILRWRRDKPPREADTLERLRALAGLPDQPPRAGPEQMTLFQ